jgi:hypothetical protein
MEILHDNTAEYKYVKFFDKSCAKHASMRIARPKVTGKYEVKG